MAINFNVKSGTCGSSQASCLSKDGCPSDVCPDFTIRRHDTRPYFKVSVEDCDGPLDLEAHVVEVSIWAKTKLKVELDASEEYFRLANDIGFEQVLVGDVIVMDRARNPEYMMVLAFDEDNKLIKVQRGYHGTTASTWKKGTSMRIFRAMGVPAAVEMSFEDITDIDGTVKKDVLTATYLVYEWQPQDTCLSGCYWFEFKVLKMINTVWFLPGGYWTGEVHTGTDGFFYTGSTATDSSVKLSYNQVDDKYYLPITHWTGESHIDDDDHYTGDSHNDGSVLLSKNGIPSDTLIAYNEEGVASLLDPSVIPSFTDESLTSEDFGCSLGEGVESVRRFPLYGEGFLIRVIDSPTKEM